ncbi:hypothetical protein [Lentibacillus halodurans]|nr:hypothetical protein [Lentibacillus halodurans]
MNNLSKNSNPFNFRKKDMTLDQHMPFLLESKLREKGAEFVRSDDWTDFSVLDCHLATGQIPMTSQNKAEKVIKVLES